MSVELRPLVLAALDRVQAVADAAFPDVWRRPQVAFFLNHSARVTFGAFENEVLVGFLFGLRSFEVVDIVSIAVAPEARRRGMGTTILRHLFAMEGVDAVTLEVDTRNEPAVELYRSAGFVVNGTRKRYYENRWDAFNMRWDKKR